MIDVHTHTQFAAFKDDYKEVIQRALKAGVEIINVGTQRDTSKRAVEIAHEFKEGVWATVGLHPIHTEKSYHDEQELGAAPSAGGEPRLGFMSRREEFDYEYYKKLVLDPKVVAIGECGLDYYRLGTRNQETGTRELQKEVFIKQIELAKEVNKPLMIHCRPSKGTDDAYEDLLQLMSKIKDQLSKVVHFYVGSLAITKKLVDTGFYFTFGGVITFVPKPRKSEAGTPVANGDLGARGPYDEAIKYIPLDRILTETDAPYVAPEPYRGKRNEPAYIIETAKKMAEIKAVEYDKIVATIRENARKVFKV